MNLHTLVRWVLRHRLFVALAWLVLTFAGAMAVTPAINAMSQDFGALPGRPGYETNQDILREYGNGGATDPIVLLVTLPDGTTVDTPGVAAELDRSYEVILNQVPGSRLMAAPELVSADRRTAYALLYPPSEGGFPPYASSLPLVSQVVDGISVAGAPMRLTGTDALFVQSSEASGPGLLIEMVVAGLAALVVLAMVFGSTLALLPLLTAIVAVLVTFLAVWGLTGITEVSFVVQFLVGLIGLGVAIDYALLIITRWREERALDLDNLAAVQRAMTTAGGAVVASGVTVGIALAALMVLPVPFLRSMGIGGLLIPLVSVLVALTLLPVALATLGPRLDRRRRPPNDRRWTAWATTVVRRPVLAALTATALLAALVVPLFGLRLGAPVPASVAASGPARDALDQLTAAGIGSGVLSPTYVLVNGDPATAQAVAAQISGVLAAVPVPTPVGAGALVVVLVDQPAGSAAGAATQAELHTALNALPDVQIGGSAAQGVDFRDAVYGNAPLMLGLIIIVTLVFLIRAFRSVLLAVKAVLLNLLSVAATFGLLTLAWQHGYLAEAIWGIDATGALTEWVPIMVFAFLFGLSMDYEVFILARMREEYDATGSTRQAAIQGLAKTGRLVTSAALILFLAFASLGATPGTEVKIFATGLGLGILLDATIVRTLLVPALVMLFGRWNWWVPRWLAQTLLIRTPPATVTQRKSPMSPRS